MSAIKNGLIQLYCNFNKIIKELRTSFQSPPSSQKHVRNVFHTAHQYLTKFHIDSTQDSKEISVSVTSIMQSMPMMTSQSLKSMAFTKTQKSRYLENKTFFLQIKKIINSASRATLWQKQFCSGSNLFHTVTNFTKRVSKMWFWYL